MRPVPIARAGTILALSHLRWDFVFQRPQQLLTRAARTFDVFYVEEPLRDGGVFSERRFDRERVTVIQPVVPLDADEALVETHHGGIVERIAAEARGPLWLWMYTPMALPLVAHIQADAIVFDKMDELSAFAFAPPELLAREAALIERADVVFTGGRAMYEAARGRHGNIHCFPSSIDTRHFGAARTREHVEPVDQRAIGVPRIGFFGVIDERFDTGLLDAVAARRPDWQFVMLGPTAKIDPARLPLHDNIHWLGPKPYSELPAYLGGWDAGWMPFAINDSTRFISPTKTPEFLAAGLPVVSTAITDVVRPYGEERLVAIAATVDESVSALATAIGPRPAAWLAAVDDRLATGSWDATWAGMRAQVESVSGMQHNRKESARV